MSNAYYPAILRDLDAMIEPAIKKYLKKYAKAREANKTLGGTMVTDWQTLRKYYVDAMNEILTRTDNSMQIGGVLKFCNHQPTEIEDEE